MSIVPETRIGKVNFYTAHLPLWRANAAALGLTTAEVDALEAATLAAAQAQLAQREAEEAAKAATQNFHNDVATMQTLGASLLRTIKNRAATLDDPELYALAAIPAPRNASRTLPPGIPSQLKVELLASGALRLAWKCSNPDGTTGTLYEIKRRMEGSLVRESVLAREAGGIPSHGDAMHQTSKCRKGFLPGGVREGILAPAVAVNSEFVYIGASGVKQFIDTSLPPGPTRVTYQITAIRSTRASHPAQFTINFGVEGEEQRGGLTITDEAA